jgi:DNA-directed RNA polymerase specialized sigma24 family protein
VQKPLPAVELDPLGVGFDELYRRDLSSVVAVVYALCGNRWAAEDLAHDAFVVAFQRWDQALVSVRIRRRH